MYSCSSTPLTTRCPHSLQASTKGSLYQPGNSVFSSRLQEERVAIWSRGRPWKKFYPCCSASFRSLHSLLKGKRVAETWIDLILGDSPWFSVLAEWDTNWENICSWKVGGYFPYRGHIGQCQQKQEVKDENHRCTRLGVSSRRRNLWAAVNVFLVD